MWLLIGNKRCCSVQDHDGSLGSLSSDPSCQLDILWHDGHTLGVDGAQVGVLEQANQVGLASLLQSKL
jgi:hypothetical protein